MTMLKNRLAAAVIVPLLAMSALAAETGTQEAVKPYSKPDNSFISINGAVTSAGPDSFVLDYGDGVITVEMDDWDWYHEGYKLIDGDNVTVYGRIDDDLFEVPKIEADSVYVKGLNSFFFASDADEEDVAHISVVTTTTAAIQGNVKSIEGREFTVDTGTGTVRVDTSSMPYNPLDKQGYQQLKEGDRVSVVGALNPGFFSKREIEADAVMTLSRDKAKQSS
nr:DUF5666 domain-containing protein [uncultured Pseudomonas sp.]